MNSIEMDLVINAWEAFFVRLDIDNASKSMPMVYNHFKLVMKHDLNLINKMVASKCISYSISKYFNLKLYAKYLKNITVQECEDWNRSIYFNCPSGNGSGSLEIVEKPENINRFEGARNLLFGDGHEMVI